MVVGGGGGVRRHYLACAWAREHQSRPVTDGNARGRFHLPCFFTLLQAKMEGTHTVLDVLRALPVDARSAVFGDTFSRRLAGCRLACRELQQFHDSTITHVHLRLPALQQRQQQQTGLASPVVKFARCSRLEVRAVGVSDPVSTVLAGSSPAAAVRERITHLVVSGWGYNQHRVAEAVAAKLPCLEELELLNDGGGSYIYSQGDRRPPPQGGICGILGTAGLPALRRLTLSRATSADLEGLGALAACPQLRELVLPVPMPPPPQARGSTDDPTHAALEGLAQLQRLEQLTLGVDSTRFSSTSERFLAKLLSSHRPPQLRGLVLLTENDKAPVLEVGFAPGGTGATGGLTLNQSRKGNSRAARRNCSRICELWYITIGSRAGDRGGDVAGLRAHDLRSAMHRSTHWAHGATVGVGAPGSFGQPAPAHHPPVAHQQPRGALGAGAQ